MDYKYKDVQKDVFIDRHEWSDIVKDHKEFIKKIEKLKSYMIEFEKDSAMKNKIYLSDCIMGGKN